MLRECTFTPLTHAFVLLYVWCCLLMMHSVLYYVALHCVVSILLCSVPLCLVLLHTFDRGEEAERGDCKHIFEAVSDCRAKCEKELELLVQAFRMQSTKGAQCQRT